MQQQQQKPKLDLKNKTPLHILFTVLGMCLMLTETIFHDTFLFCFFFHTTYYFAIDSFLSISLKYFLGGGVEL